ncbi:MAG: dihydroorotate dehydrogenase electron transfer subunit [Candidatus Omnitrophica bacterium]|nr:dihydroorotate dehydrogenase electron transfer subunit [Candidatus Omnitrophota bacterium]MBU2044219.1 dihydroorotate dehydrogenase electron transfer subunit [Candidatus Omnitrophota bacterium]MBU2265607.1 dihydroorotate dehydrogenase electron transfer subunit [Candidatus Omnitrophota bacterium]
MKQAKAQVKEAVKIKSNIYLLKIHSPYLAKKSQPGQFLHLKISSVILRRPFSIHKVEGNTVFILFRVRGRGTKALSQIKKGKVLDIIGPLGKGFDFKNNRENILIAGGIGVAPLVFLAQKLKGTKNLVLLGAKNKSEVICENEFKKLGFAVKLATDDGSRGYKGTAISLLKHILRTTDDGRRTTIYACGPKEMFLEISKVLKKYPRINCQVSFEQFMGCGLGICCACVIETKNGYQKVCKDGPVFDIKDIW